MALPKRKMEICMVQIACDGNDIHPGTEMCGRCQQAMMKRKRLGTTDARYWAVRTE